MTMVFARFTKGRPGAPLFVENKLCDKQQEQPDQVQDQVEKLRREGRRGREVSGTEWGSRSSDMSIPRIVLRMIGPMTWRKCGRL